VMKLSLQCELGETCGRGACDPGKLK
jgi:hypothetical protein